MDAANKPATPSCPRWREPQVGVLLLLVGLIFFARLTTLPLRGEETRRAMVAREILWTGDWIIPRQQGEPFLSRPPLGSYPIAVLGMILGDVTPLATRLPTALATLLTALLVYGYSRLFLSPTGALASSLGYASMGQVMQLGQIAETEAIFTLFVACSLLLWHWGYVRLWSPYSMWSVAYLFVGLGALAKGPQAPVYFAGTIGIFLLYQRQWKALFHPGHFAGVGVFAIVLGAWQIPFAWQLGWPAVQDVWGGDVGLRFVDQSWYSTLIHLITFPGEVWLYLLPSSLLLPAFLRPSFWRQAWPHHAWLSFVVISLIVTFPTCWIVPGAKPRYYMPLYPCLAILVGLVVEELASARAINWLSQLWLAQQRILLAATWGAVGLLIVWATFPGLPFPEMKQPMTFIALLALGAMVGSILLRRQSFSRDTFSIQRGLIVTTALAGLLYSGVVLNVSLNRSENAAQAVAEAKARLPANATLVSIGQLETMFTYHYGDPVELIERKEVPHQLPHHVEFFCVNAIQGRKVQLPFAWQQEAMISCDRWKRDEPQRMVVIGRRLPEVAVVEHERWRR